MSLVISNYENTLKLPVLLAALSCELLFKRNKNILDETIMEQLLKNEWINFSSKFEQNITNALKIELNPERW